MPQTSPISSLWTSVRPRTRRGAFLGAAAILLGSAVVAVALLAAASIAWSPYLDFGTHRDSNARQWAALDMRFDDSGACAACHQPEATSLHAAPHQGLGCQSCHGALLGHATAEVSTGAAGPGASTAAVTAVMAAAIAKPTDAMCIRCHLQTLGRPGTLRQIVASQHYVAQCLECHDPHSSIAIRPPVVQHPVANLPTCLTCHGPEGFKARNLRHPSGQLTDKQCLDCHDPGRGPGAGSFKHAGFAFTGAHASATCSACHTDMGSLAAFKATPTACTACHQNVEPHKGRFGTSCGDCHNPGGWSDAKIDHNQTGFTLVGHHADTPCASCHKNSTWAGTPTECSSCHERPANHESNFGSTCASCHTPDGWQPAPFDHNARTPYKLTGVHLGLACAQCHTSPDTHAGAPTVCAGCHTKPATHMPVASTVCETCHKTTAWKPATFDHNTAPFQLTGAHATVACASCHKGGAYSGLPTTCSGCHAKTALHISVANNVCETCHTTKAWKPALFAHNVPAFALTGVHTTVACASCHKPGGPSVLPTACNGCHAQSGIHSPLYPTVCTTCHSTAGWLPISYKGPHTFPMTHNGAAGRCTTCHQSNTVAYTCKACHADAVIAPKHQDVSGFSLATCAKCHPAGRTP